jgi:glycosyltransferase involved in cell wall biosynthesis
MDPQADVRIVIPALNEEASLPFVLQDIPRGLAREVVVVDNGSTDRTSEVAREAGATVLREPRRGYGGACQKGIEYLRSTPCQILVILDADHSDHPEQLPDLVRPIMEGRADMVLGSRTMGTIDPGALAPQARYGNLLASSLIWIFHRRWFTDMGPFRAMNFRRFLDLGVGDPTYGWNVEMQMKALARGLTVLEVPVDYRRRKGTSKISGTLRGTLRAGYKIISTIVYCGLFDAGERR